MVETEIIILINRKSDVELIEQNVIDSKINFPVFFLEYENHYKLYFTSDYEEWELDTAILDSFPDYEFTNILAHGRKEIRLQLTRYQSEFSTDDWGRPIETPLNETKYLIKKSMNQPDKVSSKVKVLFENESRFYFINIVNGINSNSGEKGYLIINNFKSKYNDGDDEILKDRLYKSYKEAFHFGYEKVKLQASDDFEEYLDSKKKELRKQQKLPRKIIRDFINSCNNFEIEGIIKDLDEKIIFEILKNHKLELSIEGLDQFKEYVKSSKQIFCSREIKIISWHFNSSNIEIWIHYNLTIQNEEKAEKIIRKFGKIIFRFKGEKIISIREDN